MSNMEPLAKKAKTLTMPGPIIFKARDLNTDVRLRAFETEFHVHSVVLKIHSAFFFKFLDSADKTAALTNPTDVGGFKYEWVTKIDEDGTWALVAKGKDDKDDQAEKFDKFVGDKYYEAKTFKKLLQSFYGESYMLTSVEELKHMTELADYYCALPALSRSISLPLFRQDIQVELSPITLIGIATQLRHPGLFRECAAWLAGHWSPNSENAYDLSSLDNKIRKAVENARSMIHLFVTEVYKQLFIMNHEEHTESAEIRENFCSYLAEIEFDVNTRLPAYFRKLSKKRWGKWDEDIQIALSIVLDNNLLYDGSDYKAGGDDYPNFFFCAIVVDDDFPWDRTQTEW